MARYVLTLTDAHRAAVEAHRVASGLRSHAEAIRDLIERGTRDESHLMLNTEGLVSEYGPLPTRIILTPTHDDEPIGHIRTPYGSRLKKR